jgi:capsular polysaccharide export protein
MSEVRPEALRGKKVLLLQGPVGPFFRRLAKRLRAAGAEVHKVNFNGGDHLFYPNGAIPWRGHPDDWPQFFARLLEERRIDIVLLFGDCRPIHRAARTVAQRYGVRLGAFEEGYIRPNFVTFEQFGVNGYSRLPRHAEFYRHLPCRPTQPERGVGKTFRHAALWSALYYIAAAIGRPWFPHYRHHRRLALAELFPWLRSAWRKLFYTLKERSILERLTGPLHRKFFLVPLQTSVDSQVRQHSDFRSVAQFIRHVVSSFAARAPGDAALVIKHHPLDRGFHDYSRLIRRLRAQFALGERLLYIHDQHLPTVFESMRGAVVINSTVGLSALSHDAPVKVCGVALYDIKGLTFQGSLDDFWQQADSFRPNSDLFRRFRAHLIDRTLINGSFYAGGIDATAATALASVARALLPPDPQRSAAAPERDCAAPRESESATLHMYASHAR